jgi:hypothetical protein
MKNRSINVKGSELTIASRHGQDYISLTDMLKAKEGDFFIGDWLRNRNTVEFLGIWESVHNPAFNYGEFATIRNQVGLNSYRISVKDWVLKTSAIGLAATDRLKQLNSTAITQMRSLLNNKQVKQLTGQKLVTGNKLT